jgi:hypothetical protein
MSFAFNFNLRRYNLDGRGLAVVTRLQPAQRSDTVTRTSNDVIRILVQTVRGNGGGGGGGAETETDIIGRMNVCASIALSSEAGAAAQPGGLGVDPGALDSAIHLAEGVLQTGGANAPSARIPVAAGAFQRGASARGRCLSSSLYYVSPEPCLVTAATASVHVLSLARDAFAADTSPHSQQTVITSSRKVNGRV